jgi:DNA-3-methyladenine glycosylase
MVKNNNRLDYTFFDRDTNLVSQQLLGKLLYFQGKSGIITETESYIGQDDPACHASRGRTKRTEIMFGPPGFSYVYLIYGMYYCLNVVTEKEGFPAAVLIRGLYIVDTFPQYINGPGKICKIFGINKIHNACDITTHDHFFISDIDLNPSFYTTSRIGISKGLDKPWRYVMESSNLENYKF